MAIVWCIFELKLNGQAPPGGGKRKIETDLELERVKGQSPQELSSVQHLLNQGTPTKIQQLCFVLSCRPQKK